MRNFVFSVALVGAACGDAAGHDTGFSAGDPGPGAAPGATSTTDGGPPDDTGPVPTSGATGGATSGATSGATTGPGADSGEPAPTDGMSAKFDLGQAPDIPTPPADAGCTKVDLLFVIDDSGSMADEQQTLVQSFPEFVAAMQAQLADADSYHIGVITSDAYAYNEPQCAVDGALVTQTGGDDASDAVCTPFASGARWLDEAEPDLAASFACAGQVGTDGDGDERPMATMLAAVGEPLNAPGACNAGFLRPDALLVVVVISDEEDDHELEACEQQPKPGSPTDPPQWFAGLVDAKGGVETNVVVLSLVGPVVDPCPALDKCGGGVDGAEPAARIVEFTEMFTYGSVGRICAPSYQEFFASAIAAIDDACDSFMPPL
jgi:hypothetical protein